MHTAAHERTGDGALVPIEFLERLLDEQATFSEGKSESTHMLLGISYGGAKDLMARKQEQYGHSHVASGPLHKQLKLVHGKDMATKIVALPCEACLMTRMHKFAKGTDTEYRRPANMYMARWHIDMKVILGIPYLGVLDEHLKIGKVMLVTSRADTAEVFARHLRQEEVHARRKLGDADVNAIGLRQLRMDDAKEFTKGLMETVTKAGGTVREIRIADDVEQSGRIEGYLGSVVAHVNAMIFSCREPPEFGPYVVEYYTAFIHIWIPVQARGGVGTDAAENRTSYEAYHGVGIDPEVLDLQVHAFGREVVCFVEKKNRKLWNLDPVIKPVTSTGMFMGKAPEREGFMVLVLGILEIHFFPNVVFIECEYPCHEPGVRASLIKAGLADPAPSRSTTTRTSVSSWTVECRRRKRQAGQRVPRTCQNLTARAPQRAELRLLSRCAICEPSSQQIKLLW
jgi:hypothetical protein